jgi:hypothetical protein
MTHLTEENLIRVVELMISTSTIKDVMRAACNGSESLCFSWRKQCLDAKKANDTSSIFYIHYRDEYVWWTDACEASRREWQISFEAQIRQQAASGIPVIARGNSQEILYELDEELVGLDDLTVMIITGCAEGEVARARLRKDENGNLIKQTRLEQLSSPIKLRVLEASDARYRSISHQDVSVQHSGQVQITKPLERREGEPAPRSTEELRALAKLSPAERRQRLGASAYPMDAAGRRVIPQLSPPNERPDGVGRGDEIAKPSDPPPYTFQPTQPQQQQPAPKPSYARPDQRLDQSGRGEGVPPAGGAPAWQRGNVR